MSIDAIIERVNRILMDEFEIDAAVIVPEASLRDDLDLDSLDGLDLIVFLEKEFQTRFDEKAIMKLDTVGDMHQYIRDNFSQAELPQTSEPTDLLAHSAQQ